MPAEASEGDGAGRRPVKQGPSWVPLKQAASVAGVSVSTLRNWYRKGRIEARTTRGPRGEQRMVRIDEVLERSGGRAATVSPATESMDDWVSLKQASAEAGVSISTLRNWYRKGLVESRLKPGPNGDQRVVRSDEVMKRAANGRGPRPDVTSFVSAEDDRGGSALVPVARALPDLINDLAQARERAGRAETKSEFLSEQLAETRARIESLEKESPDLRLMEEVSRLRSELDARSSELDEVRRESERLDRERAVAEREKEVVEKERDAAEHARKAAERARQEKAAAALPEAASNEKDDYEEAVLPEEFPSEEDDEYLALVQRWRARRKRRRMLRRGPRTS